DPVCLQGLAPGGTFAARNRDRIASGAALTGGRARCREPGSPFARARSGARVACAGSGPVCLQGLAPKVAERAPKRDDFVASGGRGGRLGEPARQLVEAQLADERRRLRPRRRVIVDGREGGGGVERRNSPIQPQLLL